MSDPQDWSARTRAAQALGRIDEATRRPGAAAARHDDLHPRSRLRRLEPADLRPARQSDRARSRSADRLARRRRRDVCVRLGHVGGDRAVPELGAGRADRRAAADVLGFAPLAEGRGGELRPRGRVRRSRRPRRARRLRRRETDAPRLAGDAEQSAVERHRHRRGGFDRACGGGGAGGRLRLARRRSSPGRSSSAPTSSCIRRPSISTAIPTRSPARSASRAATGWRRASPTFASCTASSSGRSRRSC